MDVVPVEVPVALVFKVFQLTDDVAERFDARRAGFAGVMAIGGFALDAEVGLIGLRVGGAAIETERDHF